MRKSFATVLCAALVLGLSGCGSSTATWTDDDLVFKGSENVKVEVDHSVIVYEDVTYYTDYATGDYDSWDEEFATNRGLKLGMSLDEFKKLYSIKNGNAVWELYNEDGYNSFDSYTGQTPAKMYEEADIVWLDLGYCKEGGKWRLMTDEEVRDAWFCDADMDSFDEVVVFAVCFNEDAVVSGISLEHFTYDDDWVEWQAWAE